MLKKFKKYISLALTAIILTSSLASFSLPVSADTVATDAQMAVIRTIIYAVETGGQVYGNVRYDDFTEAYTNSSIEYAITIGGGQWYATEAQRLLNLIRSTDPETFSSLDTAGIGTDLDTKDWSTYQVSKTSAKALCIQKIISSSVGIKCQDQLMDDQMSTYMSEARALGVTDLDSQMMCANFRHQGGLSAVKRILAKTSQPYTLDNLYAACQTDTGNQVGTYKSRQKMVYESLKKYLPIAGAILDTSNPANIGVDFYAQISFSGKNFSLSGSNVILYTPSTSNAQKWRFILQNDGSYKIINQKDNKCLSVDGSSSISGANVIIDTDNDSIGQRWFLYESDGKYTLRAACSESCVLDVTNADTADYTNIRQYTYTGLSEQKLTINKTGDAETVPTTVAISYFPACDSSYTTISTALDSIGVDSSKEYRTKIAEANGITGYTGTAEQNTQMLNLLKAGKLIKPADTESTEATVPTESTT
ncbi:MAG: RICIN domain-containing protein, partial [Ruminococcus sp.]